MIYATVNMIINDYESVCDKKVLLYRGDKNVQIRFVMKGNRFVVLDSTYAQLIIKRPTAASIFSEPASIQNDTVTLTITEDMIDEMKEIGEYTIQIRLYDDDMNARVTLPPCEACLIIEKPIAVDSSESIVNLAMVNDSPVVLAETNIDEEELFTEDNEYNRTIWVDGDLITDARLNKIENAIYYINQNGGGGSGATAPYISTELSENVIVGTGENFNLNLDFSSPNLGRGTLKVFINDIDVMSTKIDQGETTTTVPGDLFSQGTNRLVVYVLDRVGVISNSLTFYVRYGSLEIASDFDPYVAYDYGATVRYYFTPTAVDTSLSLTMYMSIDGEVKPGVACVSDTRGYYTFPSNLDVGAHACQAYVTDSSGSTSNMLSFNLVILDPTSLVVASDTKNPTIEEGSQLVLDYKVYMKGNTSFITNIYVDGALVNTGICGLETAYYRTSSLTEGIYTIKMEVLDITETVSDYITWTVTVTPSTYEMLQPITAGALFLASAQDITNSSENKEVWVGKDQDGNIIEAPLSNFAFNSESGWVDDELLITGASSVEIPLAPLTENAKYGFTLDIEFASKAIGVEDALVLKLWDDAKDCGIKITTENLILRSAEGNECNLYFTDDEITSAMFIIDRNEAKAKIYLNGVMCSAFHLSDYVVDGVSYLEDFAVSSNIKLGGSGYARIRNIRVYEVALTTNEILNNFMSNEKDKAKQKELVAFQKGDTLPTLTVYCDFSGLGKDDKKPCKIVYMSPDEDKYGKSFTLDHKQSQLQYQGTSSMAYPIKNYRLNLRDDAGKKWYYDFPNGQPECRFTLKADFMSSGHWQNTGFTKWVNDNLYDYDENNQASMNPKKWFDIQNGGSIDDTRECIFGFPCRLILINDGETPLNEGQNEPTPGNTKDMGIFNFNHDKDSTDTMGFDQENFPNCMSMEVTANSDTSAGAFMSYTGLDGYEGELEYLQQSFEMRFPDPDDYEEGWGFMGLETEEYGLKALIDWVDKSTDEEFVAEFDEHFHRDYTLRYYLMVIVCGMVDNLGKNMMLDTWDGKIWMPRFYDCDTICSYDNSGDIKFDVDIEMEQGYWNTSSSRLWTRIRDLMYDELVEKYNAMRKKGLSYESLINCFYNEQIAKIPQKYYNMDYDVKYAPFADAYMGMAHGDGYQHVKRWLKNRLIFTDTLFDYAPSYNNDVLTIRANTTEPMTIYIETYTPVYQHLSWYNNQMDKKKIDGKIAVEFTGTAMAATDQEVLIYGGSNIKRISGISSMNPNQMLIGSATRLIELDAPNCPLLADINSNKANLSPHVYLNKLNLSGCPLLGGNLRLNNSPLIREINMLGTSITGLNLPSSVRNLEILKLPNTITSLTLNDARLLHTLEFDEGVAISSVSMSNCNALTNVVNLDLLQTPSISLNNSYNTAAELYFRDTTNLSLTNMPNLERVIFTPNNEYETFDMLTLASSPDYKVTTFNCPRLSTFMTTAPYRDSYNNGDYGDIQPNTTFTTNTLDISNTQFTDVKLLCTTDVNALKLPTTVKNFYCDSSFDLDTDYLEDGDYDVVHGELVEPYTTDYEGEVVLSNVIPNLVPSSAYGSLIFSMHSPSNSVAPASGIWDLKGLSFDNFHTFGMNNDVKGGFTEKIEVVPASDYEKCSFNYKEAVEFDITFTYTYGSTYSYGNAGINVGVIIPQTAEVDDDKSPGVLSVALNGVKCPGSTVTLATFPVIMNANSPIHELRFHYGASAVTIYQDEVYVADIAYSDLYYNAWYGELTLGEFRVKPASTSITSTGTNVKLSYDKAYPLTMPARYDDYDITIKNADISPTTHNTMLYPLLVNEDNPIEGKLDYTNYEGDHLSWSFAYTDLDKVQITQPKDELLNSYQYRYNAFYETEYEFDNPYEIAVYTCSTTGVLPKFNTEFTYTYDELDNGDGTYTTKIYADSLNNLPTWISFSSGNTCTRVDKLNVSAVTSMQNMFNSAYSLTYVNARGWDTSNVTTMHQMFLNCNRLTQIDGIENWDTSKVTIMTSMFNGCSGLTSLDLSNWDTSSVPDMNSMFYNCSSLTSLDVSNFDTSKVTIMTSMFNGCSGLTSLDLSNWDTSSVTDMNSMFYNCSSLVSFEPMKNISVSFDLSPVSETINAESLVKVINNLAVVTTTQILTLGTTNLAKLTEEQIAIATNKGWTVA